MDEKTNSNNSDDRLSEQYDDQENEFISPQYQSQQTINNPNQWQYVQCEVCLRKFMEQRIQKHLDICKKSSNKKSNLRHPNKQPMKMQYVDQKIIQQQANETKSNELEQTTSVQELPKWKKKHLEFMSSLKNQRTNSRQTDQLNSQSQSTQIYSDYIQCQYCLRKFDEHVYKRHQKACQNTINRPKPPKNVQIDAREIKSQKDMQNRSNNLNNSQKKNLSRQSSAMQNKEKQQVQIDDTFNQKQNKSYKLKNYVSAIERVSIDNNVQCIYCLRKFNPRAADRHIPICKKLNNNKPQIIPQQDNEQIKQIKKKDQVKNEEKVINVIIKVGCKFCTSCGYEFSNEDKFCAECGKKRGLK